MKEKVYRIITDTITSAFADIPKPNIDDLLDKKYYSQSDLSASENLIDTDNSIFFKEIKQHQDIEAINPHELNRVLKILSEDGYKYLFPRILIGVLDGSFDDSDIPSTFFEMIDPFSKVKNTRDERMLFSFIQSLNDTQRSAIALGFLAYGLDVSENELNFDQYIARLFLIHSKK